MDKAHDDAANAVLSAMTEKMGGAPGGTMSEPSGILPAVAHTPISTQGTQTIMMKIGCAITVRRNVFASLAVNQC